MATTRLDLIRCIANEIAGEDHGLAVSAVCGVLRGLLSPLDAETRRKLDEVSFATALNVLVMGGIKDDELSEMTLSHEVVRLKSSGEQSH